MDDLYALLGLDPSASPEQIRSAHRKLAVRRHRAGVLELKDQLARMNHAFEVLTDPARRREYDAQRKLELLGGAPERNADAARTRRDGELRRAYASELAEFSARRSEEALAENAPLVDQLAKQQDARELALVREQRRKLLARRATEAAVFVVLVVLCVLAAQRFGLVR